MSRKRAKRRPKPLYRVGRSGIQGRGVFATARVRKGTRVVEYTGQIVDGAEADRRAARRKRVLFFDLEDGTFIDGDPNAPGPIVNHSCDPNCFANLDRRRIFIVAARTIEPGEELTYDYRARTIEPVEDLNDLLPPGETHQCVCGEPNCRGTFARKRGWKKRPGRPRR